MRVVMSDFLPFGGAVLFGLFGFGEGFKGNDFVIGDTFDDAGEVVLGGFEIDEADAHAQTHDVLFGKLREIGDFVNLICEIVGKGYWSGFGTLAHVRGYHINPN